MPYAHGPEWYETNLRQKEAMTPDTAPTPQEPSSISGGGDRELRIDFKQATELLAMFGGEPCEITLRITEGRCGPGMYAHYTEYPEEGCEFLGTTDGDATPDEALTPTSEAAP